MSEPRFTLKPIRSLRHWGRRRGWVVCLDGEPITIAYTDINEAWVHMVSIRLIYEHYGWVPGGVLVEAAS